MPTHKHTHSLVQVWRCDGVGPFHSTNLMCGGWFLLQIDVFVSMFTWNFSIVNLYPLHCDPIIRLRSPWLPRQYEMALANVCDILYNSICFDYYYILLWVEFESFHPFRWRRLTRSASTAAGKAHDNVTDDSRVATSGASASSTIQMAFHRSNIQLSKICLPSIFMRTTDSVGEGVLTDVWTAILFLYWSISPFFSHCSRLECLCVDDSFVCTIPVCAESHSPLPDWIETRPAILLSNWKRDEKSRIKMNSACRRWQHQTITVWPHVLCLTATIRTMDCDQVAATNVNFSSPTSRFVVFYLYSKNTQSIFTKNNGCRKGKKEKILKIKIKKFIQRAESTMVNSFSVWW